MFVEALDTLLMLCSETINVLMEILDALRLEGHRGMQLTEQRLQHGRIIRQRQVYRRCGGLDGEWLVIVGNHVDMMP